MDLPTRAQSRFRTPDRECSEGARKRWAICHPCEPISPRGMVALVSRVLITKRMDIKDDGLCNSGSQTPHAELEGESAFRLRHTQTNGGDRDVRISGKRRQMGHTHPRHRDWEGESARQKPRSPGSKSEGPVQQPLAIRHGPHGGVRLPSGGFFLRSMGGDVSL